MNRREVLTGIGASISLGLAGCTGSDSTDSTAEGNTNEESSSSGEENDVSNKYEFFESGVGLTDIEFVEGEYGNLSLTGTAINTTDSELSYVQISVSFLDASGAQIGTSMANTNNLASGQRWKWEAMFMDMDTSEVDSASITGIDAY